MQFANTFAECARVATEPAVVPPLPACAAAAALGFSTVAASSDWIGENGPRSHGQLGDLGCNFVDAVAQHTVLRAFLLRSRDDFAFRRCKLCAQVGCGLLRGVDLIAQFADLLLVGIELRAQRDDLETLAVGGEGVLVEVAAELDDTGFLVGDDTFGILQQDGF